MSLFTLVLILVSAVLNWLAIRHSNRAIESQNLTIAMMLQTQEVQKRHIDFLQRHIDCLHRYLHMEAIDKEQQAGWSKPLQ